MTIYPDKINDCIKNTLKAMLLGVCFCGIGAMVFLYSTEWLWPEFNGSHYLGSNLYLIEWDGGPIIVRGSDIRGRTCYGGEHVVPCYENNIKRKEHVVYAKHNDSWIIIKTVMRNPIGNKFYLIKKDFKVNETPKVIQSKYTKIFKDSISAAEYMLKHNINGQQFPQNEQFF